MQGAANKKALKKIIKSQEGFGKTHLLSRSVCTQQCSTQTPESKGKENLTKVTVFCCHEHKVRQEGEEIEKQVHVRAAAYKVEIFMLSVHIQSKTYHVK